MKIFYSIIISMLLGSCASDEVATPPSSTTESSSGAGFDDPCTGLSTGSSTDTSSSTFDNSSSSGGLSSESSLGLQSGGLFEEESTSSSSSSSSSTSSSTDSSTSSTNSTSDPCGSGGLGSETYTPTTNSDGVDLDKVWADVIKPENWKKCHDAGYVYDWAWSDRTENEGEKPSTVSFERTCHNGQHGSVVIKFVEGCYDDLGTASTVVKQSAMDAGVKLFQEKWLNTDGSRQTEDAVRSAMTKITSGSEWQGHRPDQCGYVESDNSPRMIWTKFDVTEEKATVSYKVLKP